MKDQRDPVAKQLEELRLTEGLDQIGLAKKLKATQGAVSRFENAKDMKLSTLRKIARALGYTVQIVFNKRRK